MVWPVWELPRRFIQLPLGKPPCTSSAGLAEDRDSPRCEEDWLDSWQTVNCCCNCTVTMCDKLPRWKPVKIKPGPSSSVCLHWLMLTARLWIMANSFALQPITQGWHVLVVVHTVRSQVEKVFLHEICPKCTEGKHVSILSVLDHTSPMPPNCSSPHWKPRWTRAESSRSRDLQTLRPGGPMAVHREKHQRALTQIWRNVWIWAIMSHFHISEDLFLQNTLIFTQFAT